MSANVEMRDKAQGVGLRAQTLSEFAESVKDVAPELADMLTTEGEDDSSHDQMYDEYLSSATLQSGIKSGRLFQGKLAISHHNLFEGSIFANVDGKERSISLVGKNYLNRAVHDDVVVVELLPRDQWKSVTENVVIDEEGELADGEVTSIGMEIDAAGEEENYPVPMASVEDEVLPAGKVVGIIRRNWRPYAGTIDTSRMSDQTTNAAAVWFYPVDRRVPRIRIKTRQLSKLAGHRLLVSIDAWSVKDAYPRGHYVRDLGPMGDKKTELESLLHEHDVPYQPFSTQILSELPPEDDKWVVTPADLQNREDFRDLVICSIDPPGCTDIDDALHCRKLKDGLWECGVHIADVTHFVKPGTAMDQEAARRGTTVYLVNQRIDMLPPLLGTNLCSLRGGVERLAFSVIWEMNDEGEVLKTRYCKSVIKSSASLTYGEAQARIDDANAKDVVTESIRGLNRFAKILRKKRQEAGSLTLSSPEVRFQLEHDSQDPVDVELKELKETNALVEEFMLLANISVARITWEKFPEVAVLRRHPSPPQTNFDGLKKALRTMGLNISVDNSKTLADSLDKAVSPSDNYFNTLVRILTTRCMMQAVYFCSGSLPDSDFWHYGLATEIYTHFTSPIRRYSDVLVHRLLAACLDTSNVLESSSLFDRVKMTEVCENLNYRHRMAQQAGRSSVELFTNLFFRGKEVIEDGYVTRVLKNGAGVLVPKYGIEGFIYAKSRDGSVPEFTHDLEQECLKNGQMELRVFTKVKVKITVDEGSIAGLRQRLRMELVLTQ